MNNMMMNNMNMNPQMGNFMYQNNSFFNHVYSFDNYSNYQRGNCKTIRLYYEGEFIQNVDIYDWDNFYSIRKKFKSILYQHDKKSFRRPFSEEVIKRNFPYETLEDLINKGVVDEHPSLYISIKSKLSKYPPNIFKLGDINNGDIIEAGYEDKIYGSGGISSFEFIDIDDTTKPGTLQFSINAPKWRAASQGLNLFGQCINKYCEAYEKEVIFPVGINKKFDFSWDKKEIKCPICSKNFIPSTMGFWKCEYQIKGEKLKDGNYEEVNINGRETNGDDFEYFDPYNNNTTYWTNLIILTGHKQLMKYRRNATIF